MAWWLLYEELYGDMDKEYPIMKKKEDENEVTLVGGAGTDTIEIKGAGDYWGYDGISITGNPTASADTINLGFSSLYKSNVPSLMPSSTSYQTLS